MELMKPREVHMTIAEFEAMVTEWIDDAVSRQHSQQTIDSRLHITGKFGWWLRHEGLDSLGTKEIRAFLAYVGAVAPVGGRWGNRNQVRKNSPRTVHTYWERLRTLFAWGVAEGIIETSPMDVIKPPASRSDQIQPFTGNQVQALLTAARRSHHPKRDLALCLFLLDTGVRASELCFLQVKDLDLENKQATILGKGHKRRRVYFAVPTLEALKSYLETAARRPVDPVFHGERGPRLTRSGVQQLVHRLGRKARLTGVRCSPHTFRHTFAIWFLRNGGQVFALQALLGHTDLTMTRRYVAIAHADLEEQHRHFSPVLRLTATLEAQVA